MFNDINTEGKDMLMDLTPVAAVHIGRIVGYERPGWVSIEFNGCEAKEARLIAGLSREQLVRAVKNGREVLIVFEQGNPDRPIVLGLMETTEAEVLKAEADTKPPAEARVDGETVRIEAGKQIILKCGKGTITINKNGKIVIRGTNLLSRSSGPNRIKGGSIQLN